MIRKFLLVSRGDAHIIFIAKQKRKKKKERNHLFPEAGYFHFGINMIILIVIRNVCASVGVGVGGWRSADERVDGRVDGIEGCLDKRVDGGGGGTGESVDNRIDGSMDGNRGSHDASEWSGDSFGIERDTQFHERYRSGCDAVSTLR